MDYKNLDHGDTCTNKWLKIALTMNNEECSEDQRNPKRMKLEHNQIELRNYVIPFDLEYFTSYSYHNLHKPEKFNFIKCYKTPLQFSKFYSVIALDFIKQPSLNKVKNLLDLLYSEIKNHINILYPKNVSSLDQNKQISKELKKFLFELCYKKFCEYWLINPLRVGLYSSKQFKRFIRILLKHMRCRSNLRNTSLRKLLLYNVGLTGYPKKLLLEMCINLIYKLFRSLQRKYSRSLSMSVLKNANNRCFCKTNNHVNETQSVKLYHKDTTRKKTFLEIVEDYKNLAKINRLSYSQINNVKYAYSQILEPGECINSADLEKCANENYKLDLIDGIKPNQLTISEDLNTINDDDFDFDDVDRTPESVLSLLYKIPSDTGVSSTPNINNNYKADKFPEDILELVKELKSHYNFSLNDYKKNVETTENNSINVSIEPIEEEVHIQCTSNEYHNIANETPRHSSKEVNMFIDSLEQGKTSIINEDRDISTDDLKETTTTKYSEAETSSENFDQETALNTFEEKRNSFNNHSIISDRYKNKLLSYSINLTKLEKSILTIIIFSNKSLYQINWDKFSPFTKTRIFQIIVYFGNLKMVLCDDLQLDCLGLKKKNVCEMENVEKLLKSMQANPCMFQKYFSFSQVEHFLILPLGKVIVDNTISQRNLNINILFSFVCNIISKFCEKVNDFSIESDLRIVLNKESLFESLSCVQIEKYILNTELSLKYANAHTQPSLVNTYTFLNDALKKFNSENFCLKNTRFCIKKNSLNEEICKSMIDIFKNIVLYIDSSSKSTGINVEAAINNALIILYHHPYFAKADASYLDSKYPKCLTSSKYDNTSGSKNHSDYEGVSIRGIEKLQIEPNVNVQTDPIDANNVSMSLVTNNIPTSVFDSLNSDQINSSITSDPQCSNYNFNNDFIHDFTNLISEQGEVTSGNLFEQIGAIDAIDVNNMFNTCDSDMIQIDDSYCNPVLFNEACPFDDITLNNCYDDIMPYETNLVNEMLEVNLQFQQAKNSEEVSLISSCDQLVNYAVSDEISLEELNLASVEEQYGFDNAGILLPPYN